MARDWPLASQCLSLTLILNSLLTILWSTYAESRGVSWILCEVSVLLHVLLFLPTSVSWFYLKCFVSFKVDCIVWNQYSSLIYWWFQCMKMLWGGWVLLQMSHLQQVLQTCSVGSLPIFFGFLAGTFGEHFSSPCDSAIVFLPCN